MRVSHLGKPLAPSAIAKLQDHGGRPRLPLADRFWPKVARGPEDACWLWTGDHTDRGYGILGSVRGGRREHLRAHRVSWEIHHGSPPPDDMDVLHSCDNPPCVNPAHLRIGTRSENSIERHAKGRTVARGPDTRPRRRARSHMKLGE